MEATDANIYAGLAEDAGDIHGARVLIGLHTDQRYQAMSVGHFFGDTFGPNARIGLVYKRDFYIDIVAEDAAVSAVKREVVQHCESVGWDGGTQPLDRIAVVVVMRRFDQK